VIWLELCTKGVSVTHCAINCILAFASFRAVLLVFFAEFLRRVSCQPTKDAPPNQQQYPDNVVFAKSWLC